MYKHHALKRWLTGALLIAAASFPAAAVANYGPDVPGSPTGAPSCAMLRAVAHLDPHACGRTARHRPRHAHRHSR